MEKGEGCYRSKTLVFCWMLCWDTPSLLWNQRVSITKKKSFSHWKTLSFNRYSTIKTNTVSIYPRQLEQQIHPPLVYALLCHLNLEQVEKCFPHRYMLGERVQRKLSFDGSFHYGQIQTFSESFGSSWPKFWPAQQPCQIHLVCVNVPILCSTIS